MARQLTKSQVEQILKLHDEGVGPSSIAVRLSISVSIVKRRLEDNERAIRKAKLPSALDHKKYWSEKFWTKNNWNPEMS
jgi:DNA invertase Pin-like site-specific DNA recombinase